jgi:3-hydroxyisobutyrate dehydrogenase-like beta-hydroxyacid dehydrogenase
MGGAIGPRLLAAGFAVVGFDPEGAKAAPHGLTRVSSLAELARACRRIVIAVFDVAQVAMVLEAMGERTVVCITTCDPESARAFGERCAGFVEAPLSGTSRDLAAGDAVGLVAGSPQAVAAAGDLLEAICPVRFELGAAGNAARAKLAINLVLQLNRAALAEGLALGERMGFPAVRLLELLKASAAHSRVMDAKGSKMARGDYAPESRVAQTLKDCELIVAEAARQGQAVPLMEENRRLLAATIDLVGGDADPAAIIEALRKAT